MNEPLRTRKTKLEWLLSPWTLLFCLTAGALTGIIFPQAADRLAPAGDSYLNLLQMCVLPIMITAVISSVARLLSSQMTGKVLGRLIGVFCLGLLMASGIGLTAGLVGKPGQDLDQKSKEAMGTLITSSTENEGHIFAPDMELFLEEDGSQDIKKNDFLQQIFPKNIFDALQKGHTLQIVFFSLLLGTALSFIPAKLRDQLLDSLDAVFQAFLLIIHWLMYLLPLGLFFLIAQQISGVGTQIMGAMAAYIFLVYIGCIGLVLINGWVMALSTKTGFLKTFQMLRQPLFLGFFTRNSYAAMPSAIESMQEGFRINKDTTSLVIPLGITICRFGTVMVFSLSVVFLAQLFDVQLNFMTILFIAFGSVLAGIASAGAPGVVAITMIGIVLTPLGLPLEVAFVLLLAVDPITDPALTLVNVHTNCAACSLIHGRSPQLEASEALEK